MTELIEELYAIFEYSFDEIFVMDANGIVVRVNSACQRHYEMKKEDIIGRNVKELQEMGTFYPSVTLEVLKTKKAVELIQKTDKQRYLHVKATPVFGNAGQLKSIISYSRDLTELMELSNKVEEMEEQLQAYKQELLPVYTREGMIIKSEQMKHVFQLIDRIADINITILLLGETGVGKSVIAKNIHYLSNRKENSFYEINCAALPETLIESELFGYESGTFTGGLKQGKKGLIEMANKGTLFLDEIGELSLSAQSKLLQVLQQKIVRPIGSNKEIPIDVRVIAATNQPLEKMIQIGTFRKDLYYRLNVVPITIPPLKNRREDIIPLVHYFLEKFNQQYVRSIQMSPKVLSAFLKYDWPGNIRELENIIERLVVTNEGVVTLGNLPFVQTHTKNQIGVTLSELMDDFERTIIQTAYEKYHSSYKVAEHLGISQSAAIRKIQKYINQTN